MSVNTNAVTPLRPTMWSRAVKLFHWGSALLLVITWAMITLHQNSDGNTFIDLHRSFGLSLLLWMIFRVIVRVISPTPAPVVMPKWQTALSHISHLVLYVLLFAMPLSGILMTWYGGRGIEVFGLFDLPSVLTTDRSQARFINELHTDVFWPALLAFTALHILAALQHQFIKKDNILARIK
ncbi:MULTISPECIES: cytochrome b [Psychrobacter]|uniref:Cytochrome b n=1 Tax=Psychrobacter raelei TaxID=2565531 RepID=A0AAT9PCR4_9GAMM|nr:MULTISPECIES: cytochrome b [unclassified Psychrobacter]UNK05203.1 cytochrome b [Psychrobacter sp. PraFG1]